MLEHRWHGGLIRLLRGVSFLGAQTSHHTREWYGEKFFFFYGEVFFFFASAHKFCFFLKKKKNKIFLKSFQKQSFRMCTGFFLQTRKKKKTHVAATATQRTRATHSSSKIKKKMKEKKARLKSFFSES